MKKHTKNAVEKLFPDLFVKKNKLSICISTLALQCFIQFVFIVCQVEGYQNMLKLNSKQLAFTSYKAFLKKQRRSGTSFPASFSAWFWRKIYFSVLFTEKKFIVWLLLLCKTLGNMCFRNSLLTRLWCYKIWNNLSNQAIFPTWPKSWDTNLNILRKKRGQQFFWKVKVGLRVFSVGITLLDELD